MVKGSTMRPTRDPDEAIVLLTSTNPEVAAWGTAFVVYSDSSSTYLLTCAHVISEVGGRNRVKAGDRQASVVASGDDEIDIAVLRVSGQLDKPSLSLSSAAPSGSSFRLHGITKLASKFQSQQLSGALGRAVTVFCRGSLMGHKAWELQMDGECKLQQGQSGSPLLTTDGKCIAIAAMRKNQGDSGIAIAIDALRNIWPDRPEHILPSTDLCGGVRPSRGPRANLNDEVDVFERIVSGIDSHLNVFIIHAESGMGKTRLVREYLEIAAHYQLITVVKNLNQQLHIDDFLMEIASKVGSDHFENLRQYRRSPRVGPFTLDGDKEHFRLLAVNFFDDLMRLKEAFRLVVLIDQYEKADKIFKEWFGHCFLPKIGLVPWLLLVVAGQEEAGPHVCESWVTRLKLQKPSPECWVEYSRCCGRRIPVEKMQELHKQFDGLPYDLATILQALPVLGS